MAGSERLKETGNTDRDAVRETGFINKSLFTLGQVGVMSQLPVIEVLLSGLLRLNPDHGQGWVLDPSVRFAESATAV